MICAGNDRLFAGVATALGHPEWADDARFKGNRQRLVNRETLVALMTETLQTDTRAAWAERLQAAGVPVSPVQRIEEVAVDPQVRALDMLRPVPGADFILSGLPMSFDGVRPAVAHAAPGLGADQARLDAIGKTGCGVES
jgi:crotonobetainyl-CoA:carnitine CoA-transferase CaiB-like acyl-CoA transferase